MTGEIILRIVITFGIAAYALIAWWQACRRRRVIARFIAQARAEESRQRREKQQIDRALAEPIQWNDHDHLDTGDDDYLDPNLLKVQHLPTETRAP